MFTKIKKEQRALVIGLTTLGCLLTLFFGLRAFHALKKFQGHPLPPLHSEIETDVDEIRDWMTIPFISQMYGVPEDDLFDALEIPPHGNRRKSIEELNREFYPHANGLVIEIIKTTILAHQAPPTPIPPAKPLPPLTPIPAAP